MTIYHRYVIAGGDTVTLDELQRCLRACDSAYDIDGEHITYQGEDRGIIIDVTQRGDPIFDGDIDLLERHANREKNRDELHRELSRCNCMVTTQISSNCDEGALEVIWNWLRDHRKGILAWEGGGFRIDVE